MALYRKYRPATFAEVVGQEHVTDPLSTALDTGRISHAYLFSGPRGCGKTSSARILARSLNCVEGPTSTPCGVCSSCVALAPGGPGNLDVIELDAASHGGVDDTRELRDRAFYAPAESRYRVFIVDEAHMVTTAGFNALLKIVEEPPAHLIFVFATTEPDKVLPTIRSRTHHYPFRLLPPATMRALLGRICDQEGVQVEESVYPLVIRAGGGSPRDSLSVLDQLLAGAGSEGVTYPRAVSLLGVTDIALIDDAVEALATDDGAALFGVIDRVVESGHDPRRFATDLLERLRDLILLRAVPDATDRGLVSGPGDVLDRMRVQADAIGPATLTRYAELLHEGLGEMRGATAPRLLLEVIAARMLLPSATDTESAALQRLERIERRLAGGAPLPPASGNTTAGDPAAGNPGSAGGAPPHPGAQSAAGAPAAQPNPGGSPRRRGAEALAALRAEKSGTAPANHAAGYPAPTSPNSEPGGTYAAPDGARPVANPGGGAADAGRGAPELGDTGQSGDPAARQSSARLPSGTSAARPPELDPVTGGPSDSPKATGHPNTAASQQQSPSGTTATPGGGATRSGAESGAGSPAASVGTTPVGTGSVGTASDAATSAAAQPVSSAPSGASADFERARETLLMLVGYASARAVAEPQWTEKLTGWAARLHTLTPAATAEIQTVLTEDAAALRELLGSAASVVHGPGPATPDATGAPGARADSAIGTSAPAAAQRATQPSAAARDDSPATRSDAPAREQASEGIGGAAAQGAVDGASRGTATPAEGVDTQAVPASVIAAGLQDSGASADPTAGRGASRGGEHGVAGEHGQPRDRAVDASTATQHRTADALAPEGDSESAGSADPSTGGDFTGTGANAAVAPVGHSAGAAGRAEARAVSDPAATADRRVGAAVDETGAVEPAAESGAFGTAGEGARGFSGDSASVAPEPAGAPEVVGGTAESGAGSGRPDAGPGAAAAMAAGAEHAAGAGGPEGAGASADADLLAGAAESAGADTAGDTAHTSTAHAANGTADTAANGTADTAANDTAANDSADTAAAGTDVTAMVEGAWVEIKAKVREFGPALPALLAAAAVARVEGDVIVLAHQHAALAQRLSEAKNLEAVRSTVRAVLGREFEVRWEVGGAAQGGAGRSAGNAGRGAGVGGGPAPAKKAPPKFSRPSQAKAAAAGAAEPRTDTSGGWGAPSSGSRDGESSGGAPAAPPDDDIPLPDGPDLPDDPGPSDYSPVGYDRVPPASTEEEEREMLADAAVPVPAGDRRDPDEMALELLRSELGATPLEG
ncbi:DNA polymerase III subunit gamma and tau [Nocardia sp. CC227C]|uniref:DNA polymerase III subunit gamma and tau n=1 Tax=Nocardia sp. CC227C TaxID=3044562 RepID=UPI00278BDD07|nr:DNA polymerase III subunit gamma and tau [Nocardia sp. CC227C]